VIDVASDDHHRADFGDRPAETGKRYRDQAESGIPQHCAHRLERRHAKGPEQFVVLIEEILYDLPGECCDDRRYENGLSDDHRGRRVEQS